MRKATETPRSFEPSEGREAMEVRDTKSFTQALESDIVAAESWLDQIRNDRAHNLRYDDRWLDHRERELFRAYYSVGDWAGAKRVVEVTADPMVKKNRMKRLEELSGLPYDHI